MKYKVGDKVTVRKDLDWHKTYYMDDGTDRDGVTEEMLELRGKEVTITKAEFKYKIAEDDCWHNWTDEMFESVSCADNCKCNQIKIEEVDMPYGKQLKFAVGEEGVNDIGILDEIEKEIVEFINHKITMNGFRGFGVLQTLYSIKDEVIKTIEKYRER